MQEKQIYFKMFDLFTVQGRQSEPYVSVLRFEDQSIKLQEQSL